MPRSATPTRKSWTSPNFAGLPAADAHAWFSVFREFVAETIVVRGFLPDVAPVVAAPVVARHARGRDAL